jgi:hypothetical protein
MKSSEITDPLMCQSVKTSDGRPWVQRCFICSKPVDFLKMKAGAEWVRVGPYVRHKKCRQMPLR